LQPPWRPKPGDTVVRRPRQSEIAPVYVHVVRRTLSVRGATSPMLLIYGFMGVLVVGTLLLWLPISTSTGEFAPFVTALFTATSAICVTGLVVVDSWDAWSGFGQFVIAVLIFIGGLGFMTGASFLLILVGQRIGLQNRLIMREGIGGGELGAVVQVVRNLVIVAVLLQFGGAVFFYLEFYVFGKLWPGIGPGEAAWQAVFQSISAFNNAGFDILPNDKVGGDTLIGLHRDYWTLATTAILIVAGGLSFPVIHDLATKRRFSRITLDSKMVVTGTLILLLAGAVLYLVADWTNPGTLGDRPVHAKVVNSVFESVTTRTAGFSTVDVGQARNYRLTITESLMFIGGATASTAGGIKVGTAMVVFFAIVSTMRGRRHVRAFGREIPLFSVQRAMVVGALATFTVVLFLAVFMMLQPAMNFGRATFEVISALGTVGLSTGITAELTTANRVLLVFAMFIGRFGPFTLALLMAGREAREPYRLAEERVRIG